uniref:Uncharacterized protein n=1 Tax=Anguilla anguilla TaxID=7936 RepID=A0A0E9T390_ANGAN
MKTRRLASPPVPYVEDSDYSRRFETPGFASCRSLSPSLTKMPLSHNDKPL